MVRLSFFPLLVMTAACVVDLPPSSGSGGPNNGNPPPGNSSPDAASPTPDAPPADAGAPDAAGGDAPAAGDGGTPAFTCREPVNTTDSGMHNAGARCMDCHNGAIAPRWTVAGTIYTDAAGSAPLVGATITVRDAAGKEIDLVSARNGNFYTLEAVEFPVRLTASRCPDVKAMSVELPERDSCNRCHAAGSQLGRIHLP